MCSLKKDLAEISLQSLRMGRGLTSNDADIAREMHFSETTFLFPPEQSGDFQVRIFTPEQELPFAGHPIVGTAHVIVAERMKANERTLTTVTLETGVGLLLSRSIPKMVTPVTRL